MHIIMIIETINCGEQHYIGKTYEKSQGHSNDNSVSYDWIMQRKNENEKKHKNVKVVKQQNAKS